MTQPMTPDQQRRWTLLSWALNNTCCSYHAVIVAGMMDAFVVSGEVPTNADLTTMYQNHQCDDDLLRAEPAGTG